MGAANSRDVRTVSMDNPTPSGVIDISDEVVQRLKKAVSKNAQEQQAAAPPSAPAPPPPKKETPPSASTKHTPPPAPVTVRPPTVIYQAPPTVYMAPSGPTITAADVMRQKEIELNQNDTMWRQRMAELEQTLKKTNSIMEDQYASAVEDVRKRFATASAAHQLPPCQDLKAKVIACYKENRGETLKCADTVIAFQECVSMNRIKKLDAVDATPAAAVKAAKGA